VALTRARDRLYLASEVKDGRWRASAPGSLGEVLPPLFKAKFEAAALLPAPSTIEWTAASGRNHSLRMCPVPEKAAEMSATAAVGKPAEDSRLDNFGPLADPHALPRIAVTAATAVPSGRPRAVARVETSGQSLAGTLVHRLFDRVGTALGSQDGRGVAGELERLIRAEELAEVEELDNLLERAGHAYLALCAQPILSTALESGEAFFEVPFSVRPARGASILRGTFDCLVRRNDGGVTILELKTGKPMPEHQHQLDAYLMAARALFPGAPVEGTLVYAHHARLDDRSLDAKR
jgi:ATP-dependent exoDNAse (exonuclease V) beta subunit